MLETNTIAQNIKICFFIKSKNIETLNYSILDKYFLKEDS